MEPSHLNRQMWKVIEGLNLPSFHLDNAQDRDSLERVAGNQKRKRLVAISEQMVANLEEMVSIMPTLTDDESVLKCLEDLLGRYREHLWESVAMRLLLNVYDIKLTVAVADFVKMWKEVHGDTPDTDAFLAAYCEACGYDWASVKDLEQNRVSGKPRLYLVQ